MASVTYDHVTKSFGDTTAVNDLLLEVAESEFMVLVGPSGCGKSTALRMLAGLEKVTDGRILIGDRVVNNVAPQHRDIAMVFQSYALYPHMTVYDNLAFGLRNQGVSKKDVDERVRRAAGILDLDPLIKRKPKQLSGGQRQRVALGRAIVRDPAAFLMDEPLSNLDAKLRVQTRTEVVELQTRLGVTTVYVTHDQVEAMTMGDRVAVLKEGVLQQCDVPGTLYHEPSNLFVAGFIGSPAMNLVPVGEERPLRIGVAQLEFDAPADALLAAAAGDIRVGFRPEVLRVGDGPLRAQIRTVEDLGPEVFVHVAIEHRGESVPLVSKMQPPFHGELGDRIGLQITGTTHLFAGDGSRITSTSATLR